MIWWHELTKCSKASPNYSFFKALFVCMFRQPCVFLMMCTWLEPFIGPVFNTSVEKIGCSAELFCVMHWLFPFYNMNTLLCAGPNEQVKSKSLKEMKYTWNQWKTFTLVSTEGETVSSLARRICQYVNIINAACTFLTVWLTVQCIKYSAMHLNTSRKYRAAAVCNYCKKLVSFTEPKMRPGVWEMSVYTIVH